MEDKITPDGRSNLQNSTDFSTHVSLTFYLQAGHKSWFKKGRIEDTEENQKKKKT